MSGQSHLLASRRFLPLFVTQFLGAFNDNVFKNALVVLLTFQAARWTTLPAGILANLAAGVFILPFFLFSATAGQLADKFDKARLARLVKVLEIVIMVVAGLGFWLTSLAWLFAALFLLGCHSTLFGPIKYALLPQHLRHDELLGGNALVEAGTFVAILLGTLAGGLLAGADAPLLIAGVGLVVAVAGYLASRAIPPAPAPEPAMAIELNPFRQTWRSIGYARENRSVFQSILGISWFWLFGALFLAQFPAYAKNCLGGGETAVTLLLATFTIGVGLGSLACEKLSGRRVELGLVPFGSIGLTLFALDLALASPAGLPTGAPLALADLLGQGGTWRILIDLALIGLFGGFFIVPLYALVQMRSRPEARARIIAANNIMNALFMVVGALVAAGLLAAGLTIPELFAVAALMNAVVALYIYTRVPEFLIRFVVWLVLRVTGRVEAEGMEQLPVEGGVLLVLDSETPPRSRDLIAVLAACERPIRFLLDRDLEQSLGYRVILRGAKAIYGDHAEAGRAALNDGQVVAVAHDPVSPGMLLAGMTVPVFTIVLRPAAGPLGKTRVRVQTGS
jgi:MFS family permease